MAHSKFYQQPVKAVMVSVTYHRNCFIYAGEMDNLEEKAREQLRMPNDPLLDPEEWSEDEFTVLEIPEESLTLSLVSLPHRVNNKKKKNESSM